ncbi:MAG: aconitase X catalytic domain-containing protein [Candidatus Aenigmarchaeota archaeon]|nr:aconitase X catalytic domain-containing protein [Candidatus Aenigmarchaeota archaeon]
MELNKEETEILNGRDGNAAAKSMEILYALGEIFGAEKLIDISSVQVAGVSYNNLGDAGLEYLNNLAVDGKVKVKTMLNPAGMDLIDWKKMGIEEDFAQKQIKVIEAFKKLGIRISATCTPYLIGIEPKIGEHIAWSESSAVIYANSVLGAKTNREGGPSALAAAIVGKTPCYGLHLDKNRQAEIKVFVESNPKNEADFSALGYSIGKKIENKIPLIYGIKNATGEELKNFGASLATYGGTAIFHMDGITPNKTTIPGDSVNISKTDIADAYDFLNDREEIDFVSVGCPHASIAEIQSIAKQIEGKSVKKPFWICIARKTKEKADELGLVKPIEQAGVLFACDTCMAVSPLKNRFKCMATNSAKACFYGRGTNNFNVRLMSLEDCIKEATE